MKIVCFKWEPMDGYRSKFTHEHVNTLFNMVYRHYQKPFEMVCVTDNPQYIDRRVRIIPMWDDHANVPSPHGGLNPSCYRRLKIYSREAKELIGERFVSIDLDVVLVDDVTPVWDRPEDFMIWGETLRRTPYNGSMQMMTAGARSQVWDRFDPATSPQLARKAGMDGSDQGWISFVLGPNEKRWNQADGVHSFRLHVKPNAGKLPKGARIVFFEGQIDPWTNTANKLCPWIKDHYR